MLFALTVSIALHFVLIGLYYLQRYVAGEDEPPVFTVRMMKYSELGPPPSIQNVQQLPTVGVSVAAARPSIGIPVPVPDMEISPEQTIATQQELSQVQSPVMENEASNNNVVIKQDIQIAPEDEPGIDEFVPVEKYPIAVRQIFPEYPEIARRTGTEGSVWVKVLVDKQGKVKKVVVVKSDSELFNDPAVQAAGQWLFTPAIMNAGPISVWVVIPFHFHLNKQSP